MRWFVRHLGRPVARALTGCHLDLGYNEGYRYAHDEPEAYAAGEDYFPEALEPRRYYQPVPRGLELKIAQKLQHLRSLDAASSRQRRKDD